MSLDPLNNPFERLEYIPDLMAWKGTWNVNTQYVKGDVAECPTAISSYVCNVIADRGGAVPSLNPNWIELSNAATGVLSVATGAGLNNIGTATNVNLVNTGIIGLTVAGAGLASTGGNTPQLTNTGVVSFTANSGLQNIGTATAPIVNNTGILSLNVGAGLSSTGGQNPTISVTSASPPTISRFTNYQLVTSAGPDPTGPGGTLSVIFVSENPPNKVANDLANGASTPTALWRFDLSKYLVQLSGAKPVIPTDNLTYSFIDSVTAGGPYQYNPLDNQIDWISFPSASLPYVGTLGSCIVDVAAFRATGAREITSISIFNNTPGSISFFCKGDCYCDYFPNGLV